MPSDPEVSVIIPCLDEAANAASYHETLLPGLAAALPSFEVIFSDGGSSDGTLDALWKLSGTYPGVTALSGGRRDFRESLQKGAEAARGRYVLFMEADLSFDPADAGRLLAEARTTGADCVCGSPFRGAFSGLPLTRRLLTWTANLLFRLRFRGGITSYTQIFKLYRAEKLKALRFETEGFALDAELLIKGLKRGWKVAEVPVTMRARAAGRSKLAAPRETLNCLKLLFRTDYIA